MGPRSIITRRGSGRGWLGDACAIALGNGEHMSPQEPSQRVSDKARRLADAPAKSTRHILIVDDDDAFCYAAGKVLRNAGFVVSLAPDHNLALEILERPESPDLLITDLVMPGALTALP